MHQHYHYNASMHQHSYYNASMHQHYHYNASMHLRREDYIVSRLVRGECGPGDRAPPLSSHWTLLEIPDYEHSVLVLWAGGHPLHPRNSPGMVLGKTGKLGLGRQLERHT